MLVKNQAKIKVKYYEQIFDHLISLHKPSHCFTLATYLPLVSEFCDPCQISENIFFFLNLLMNVENLLRQKPLIPAPSYQKQLDHLTVVNLKQIA